jgi:hypothetical protein
MIALIVKFDVSVIHAVIVKGTCESIRQYIHRSIEKKNEEWKGGQRERERERE